MRNRSILREVLVQKTKNLIITNLQRIIEFMKLFWLLANKIVDCKQKKHKNADA